jgi:hypothetical protein
MTNLSIALLRLPLLPSFNFTYYCASEYHIFSPERNPYTASSNVGIFSCATSMTIASAVSNVLQMKKKEKKKSYVSHEFITVLELMQNEVNETITALLDCNL